MQELELSMAKQRILLNYAFLEQPLKSYFPFVKDIKRHIQHSVLKEATPNLQTCTEDLHEIAPY